MAFMFKDCSAFNQEVKFNNVKKTTNFEDMFNGATLFNENRNTLLKLQYQ